MPNADLVSEISTQPSAGFLQSGLFTEWCDPVSGVISHILTRRVAPVQQSFYFTSPSITNDGRYYWFYCAFPPSGSDYHGRTLAVADLETGEIVHHPNTQFLEASPLVDRHTGEVYWCNPAGIWKLAPHANAEAVLVNRFSPEFVGCQNVRRYATHLTLSADGTALNIDAEIGNKFYIGSAPLDGGDIEIWQEMDHCYKHGQWNPADPDLMLIGQDHWINCATWTRHSYKNRLWLIRRGSHAEAIYTSPVAADPGKQVLAHERDRRTRHGHEWWGADGKHIWYVHYGHGVERIALGARTPQRVWNIDHISHAHADATGRFLVCDGVPPPPPPLRQARSLAGDILRQQTAARTRHCVTHDQTPPLRIPLSHPSPSPFLPRRLVDLLHDDRARPRGCRLHPRKRSACRRRLHVIFWQ